MARAPHIQPAPASVAHPNVARESTSSRDVFTGTAEALIAAGLITAEQLTPQKGRTPGHTSFMPTGEPCPIHLRTWRSPGFKAIRQQKDGSYRVEVTVPHDVQSCRREAEKAAAHEAERARINQDVVENGPKYSNWQFKQAFSGCSETWEGTKEQLQAAGLGVGLKFPGEPGALKELRCKCALGFDFVIRLPDWDRAKKAARIYTAHSWYDSRRQQQKQFTPTAPGVVREVWTPESYGTDSSDYYGTAEALMNAGLVPSLRYFPGQPGANKMQASYLKDWQAATKTNGQDWGATIRKCGNSGQFSVRIPVGKEEFERRKALSKAREEERKQNEQRLSAERRELRQGADRTEKTDDDFRNERARLTEFSINLLWSEVFAKSDGPLSFDVQENSELWDDLAEAFQTIRDAVQVADILRDKKQAAAVRNRLKLVAARNDKGLQSVLREATGLRLVHSRT